MEILKQKLQSIGLSDKETVAYLTLLANGTSSTSSIAKSSNLNRGTTYLALHSLLEKGLVTKSSKKKIQFFSALEPQQLESFLERRLIETRELKNEISSMMGQFEALISPLSKKPRVQFYDGIEGVRTALNDTLKAENKTLRSFLSIFDIAEFLGAEWFEQYVIKRISQGYHLLSIRAEEKDKRALADNIYASQYRSSTKDKREVRYINQDLAFPLTMYIYDNKVAMISSKKENFAVIVESKEVSEMQKKLFDLIWNGAKKVNKLPSSNN